MAKGTAPQGRNLDGATDVTFGSAGGWLDHLTFRLVFAALSPMLKFGTLNVRFRDQPPIVLGDETGTPNTVRVNSARFLRRMFLSPDLAIGEGYMNGEWDVETGDLATLVNMLLASENAVFEKRWMKGLISVLHLLMDPHKKNDPKHSRSNVAHHYDIGNDLYRAFLDEGMNYSCAFFESPEQSLR
ncbi:MAG: class I SAM-dependent methyltransferase, partial [Pseudomonadota bacterium]